MYHPVWAEFLNQKEFSTFTKAGTLDNHSLEQVIAFFKQSFMILQLKIIG